MKLYIRQSVFSLGEKFSVQDASGQDLFQVRGSFLMIPKQFDIIQVDSGETVATITKQFPTFLLSRYDINAAGQHARLIRKFALFHFVYELEGIDWRLEGDILAHDFALTQGGRPVMSVHKKWFSIGDFYELDVANEADALLALSIVICIDLDIAQSQSSASTSAQ